MTLDVYLVVLNLPVMTQVVIPVIWGVISADCVLPDLIVGDWYGMWSTRPLLIVGVWLLDSLKSAIPGNVEH